MKGKKYFADNKTKLNLAVRIFLVFLVVFSVTFFLWSVMRYNELMEEKRIRQERIDKLAEEIDELKYLVEAPLDDKYKIRLARQKLGMCFPDEIIYHTQFN